uniref:Uncharacterized protein n=1 Tax=Caenorhabditis japonica TaxID=281687 RepID=A0A8R1IIK6_CAEJA
MIPMTTMWIHSIVILLLTCCPNRVWYGIVAVFVIIECLGRGLNVIYNLQTMKYLKYYPYGAFGREITSVVATFCLVYLAIILMQLSFFYIPPEKDELDECSADGVSTIESVA